MARILTYASDSTVSLDDKVIGSDAEGNKSTLNYKISSILDMFKSALNLSSIEYIFSDGTDVELTEDDAGYITTGSNETSAPSVTSIKINKTTSNGADITNLINVVLGDPSGFILKLQKTSVVSEMFYFSINSIVDSGLYYTITVANVTGTNVFTDATTYGLMFEFAGAVTVNNITNNPDDVDIESVLGVLKLKDRGNYRFIDSGFDLTTIDGTYQDDILEIRNTHDLGTGTVTLPTGVILKFNGGSIINGTITGADTSIDAPLYQIFGTDVTIAGTWNHKELYPQWFGAVGDNVADDTIPIQKAIDALPEGGVLHFPVGHYKTTTEVSVITNGVIIKGSGRGSIIETTSTTEHIIALRGQAVFPNDLQGVRVTNLAFRGPDTGTAGAAIYLNRGHENMIDHNFIGELSSGTAYGIYVEGNSGANSDNNTITNNSVTRCTLTGIRVVGNTADDEVEENVISNNNVSYCSKSGISVTGQRNSITGNAIEESLEHGMAIDGGYNSVVGNTVCESTFHGIVVSAGADNNSIVGNTCRDNDLGGVGTYDGINVASDYNTITGNVCYNNAGSGIHILVTANHNIVSANQLRYNAQDGLTDEATNTHIATNITDAAALNGHKIRMRRQVNPLTINEVSTTGLSTTSDTTWNFHKDLTVPYNALGVILDFEVRDSGASTVDAFFKIRSGDTLNYPTAIRCVPADDRWIERDVKVIFKRAWDTGVTPTSINRTSNVVTVVSTAHGLNTGDVIQVLGADQVRYNGIQKVTRIDANSFSYIMAASVADAGQNTTPPTGTITYEQRLYQLTYEINASGSGTFDASIKVVGWILEE